MNEYSVLFLQPLWDIEEDQPPIFMEKSIFLPFVPFVGIEVISKEFTTLTAVQRVVWRSDLDQFWAYCPDDFSLRETSHLSTMDKLEKLSDLIELYQSYGWVKTKDQKG